jgi:urea carboxylase-associated protein 2
VTEEHLKEETPDFYRMRYEELKARAQKANARPPIANFEDNPLTLPAGSIVTQETIPGGWYWSARVPRGISLRIVNENATPGVSALLWNADDTSERFNPADTLKLQWSARLSRGKVLLSDMGRVLASITADTCGMHDALLGGSTRESDLRHYGPGARVRNSRNNFTLAAAKHGLGPRDVGPCITFFAPVTVSENGRFHWEDGVLKPGQYIDLRAEMNLLVALSNCPHPLSPGAWQTRSVNAMLWRSAPISAHDWCRTATEEAARAFDNTDAAMRF